MVLHHSELLGPKDRQLVAPSVRAGKRRRLVFVSADGASRFVSVLRTLEESKGADPALTDRATNCQSFAPKACVSDGLNNLNVLNAARRRAG
jgi:hypothetical protein